MSENITYTDHEGVTQHVRGVSLTQDKTGRYWLWSEQEEQNLAYKPKNREDTLLAALDSALFLLSLKQERIDELSMMQAKGLSCIESIKEE